MALHFNLNSLVTFVAVADAGSFRAAAEALHTSQSAVSARIRQLEERLGVRLFDRTTRSVNLTAQGSRLFAVANAAYMNISDVAQVLRQEVQLERGEVTLAAMPSMAQTSVPSILAEFRDLHPGISLKLLDVDSQRSLDMLASSEVDLAIVAEPADRKNVVFEPLFWNECFVLAPKDHPLTKLKTVSLKHVVNYPLILGPRGTTLRQILEKAFLSAGLPLISDQRISNMLTLTRMVEEGFGIGIAPEIGLRPLDTSRCAVISLREHIGWTVGVARMGSRAESPASAALRSLLTAKYGGHDRKSRRGPGRG